MATGVAAAAVGTATWAGRRFDSYARACLVAAIFLSVVAVDMLAIELFTLVKLTVIWCLGVPAIGLWIAWSVERRVWPPRARMLTVAAAFIGALALATTFSEAPAVSLVGLQGRYGGLLPYVLYASVMLTIVGLYWEHPHRVADIAWASVAGSVFLAGYVLLQAAGLDPTAWVASEGGRPGFPFGSLGNSNFAGAYLGMALPFVLYAALTVARPPARALLAAVAALDVLALWHTQTRGGLVGALAGLATMAVLYRDRLPRWVTAAGAGAVAAIVAAAALVVFHPGLDHAPGPLAGVHIAKTTTLDSRTHFWVGALRIFLAHPVLGTGPDTYYASYPRDGLRGDDARFGLPDEPHNIFAGFLAGSGVAGGGTFLLLLGLGLWYGGRRSRRLTGRARVLLTACVGALAAYAGQGFFSMDVPPLPLLGWTVLGAIAAIADPRVVAARRPPDRDDDGGGGASSPPPSHRLPMGPAGRWTTHAAVAAGVVCLVGVGIRPLQADAAGRAGRYALARRLNPLNSFYPAQAGATARSVGKARTSNRVEKQRWLSEAAAQYRAALRLAPGNVIYIQRLAELETYRAQVVDPTRFAEADYWWKRAMAQDPHDPEPRQAYEEAVAVQRRSAAQLENLANLHPDDASTSLSLAEVYVGLGEPERARAALNRVVAVEPDNSDARALLSDLNRRPGKP